MATASVERSWNVAIRAQGEASLEVAVYDVIGQDFWTGEGVTSKDILAQLRAAPKAKKIDLRVNSVGGIVDEAKAMVNLLNERGSAGVEVIGWVDGLAASSAAYLLTAAKRVVMPANAFQMIHGVRGGVRGTAEEIEAAAVMMRRTNEQLAEAFAAASARRGKGKTKEDFLAAFAAGDLYLDADEAIEWGLADEKLEALKLAACLADLSGIDNAPEALRAAPYVMSDRVDTHVQTAALVAQQQTTPSPAREQSPIGEENTMSIPKTVLVALGLNDEADEALAVGAIKKLQSSAQVGKDIEALVGAAGPAALGAVRALKASQEANAELAGEVAKLKVVNARRDFDALRERGLKDRQLTPAEANLYAQRFQAALDAGADGTSVVEDLSGWLQVAARRSATPVQPPVPGTASEAGPMQHNGKPFEAMAPIERKRLKDANPELYTAMREDAEARGAL